MTVFLYHCGCAPLLPHLVSEEFWVMCPTVRVIAAHICPKLRMMRYDVSFPIHPLGVQTVPKTRLSSP